MSDMKADDVAKDTELNQNDEANAMPSAEQEVILCLYLFLFSAWRDGWDWSGILLFLKMGHYCVCYIANLFAGASD